MMSDWMNPLRLHFLRELIKITEFDIMAIVNCKMKRRMNMRKIRTKSTMYITLLLTWLALLLLVMPAFIQTVRDASEYQGVLRPLVLVLVVLNALFISYFWLNGLKDIIYVSTFYLNKHIYMEIILKKVALFLKIKK